MCVYLASHGLIASHLAIYKQASLKNNECVKSTNANSTPGNCSWWGEGELMWARWFVLFSNEGEMQSNPLNQSGRRGRHRHYARQQPVLWLQRVGPLWFVAAVWSVEVSTHSPRCLVTLAGRAEVGASLQPALQDICACPRGFPRMLGQPPSRGTSLFSSAPFPSAALFF